MEDKFGYSIDKKHCEGPFNSRDNAVRAALEEVEDANSDGFKVNTFTTCEFHEPGKEDFDLHWTAELALESLAEQAMEEAGDAVEDWPKDWSKEEVKQLGAKILDVVWTWLEEKKDLPPYYKVRKVVTHIAEKEIERGAQHER